MSVDWFAEMRRLPRKELLPSKKCEVRCSPTWSVDFSAFSTRTRPWFVPRLVGPLSAERLCRYVLRAVFASLMGGR